MGGDLSLPIAFSRACISVAVNVVGIGVGAGAVGARGWFCRRVVIRSICFFLYGHKLLLLLLFVVSVFLIVVMHLFAHGFHEGVQADALLDRLFRWFWGWNRWS